MKSKKINPRYVEWLSAERMHGSSKNWISELSFIKEEQDFLRALVKNNTIHLAESTHFEESKKVVNHLSNLQNETRSILKAVKTHEYGLGVMVDGIDQPKEEEEYKEEHRALIIEVSEFFEEYRTLKKQLYSLIKSIMKAEKQKRLLKKK